MTLRIEGRITGREHLWWWGDAATCDGIDGDSTELISEVRVHDDSMIDYDSENGVGGLYTMKIYVSIVPTAQ